MIRVQRRLGAEPAGCLFFSPTRFAAQFMRRVRDAPAAAGGAVGGVSQPAAPATPAAPGSNNSTAVNGYDAYFGSYRVDARDGRIVTLLEGALSPENVGQEYTRDARVAGNLLYIRLTTTRPDGVAITRTLTFERGESQR